MYMQSKKRERSYINPSRRRSLRQVSWDSLRQDQRKEGMNTDKTDKGAGIVCHAYSITYMYL